MHKTRQVSEVKSHTTKYESSLHRLMREFDCAESDLRNTMRLEKETRQLDCLTKIR
jgi:hypothetical protein